MTQYPFLFDQPDCDLTPTEAMQLGATDSAFFYRAFFPKTCRQAFPPFHKKIDEILDNPQNRYANIVVFRGGAKTSKLRLYTAKRIAYGLAHTVMYIGKSEGHATRSIRWLRSQVMFNRHYADTFKLRPGDKWQDIECEIRHGIDEYPIWLFAAGITGSTRGVNFEDYRPDLIILDDVLDDENSASDIQRNKITNLVYGAVMESLAPEVDAPDAKMVSLATPQNKADYAMKALKSSMWKSAVFGCWTPETKSLPVEQQKSAWEEREPTPLLRQKKLDAIRENRLSTFMREKECVLTSPETASFRLPWLKYYDAGRHPARENMNVVMWVDPVPPPTQAQIEKGMSKKDFEALGVVGRQGNEYYILEYTYNRGHDPSWTVAEFFRLAMKWNPRIIGVETVAYQATLSWILKRAMEQRSIFFPIYECDDKRKKLDVIVDGLKGISSHGHLHCIREQHEEFISMFEFYPDVEHDDVIEVIARCCTELQGLQYSSGMSDGAPMTIADEEHIPELTYAGGWGAP